MKTMLLKFIGVDSCNRPVYEDEQKRLFKDTNCGDGTMALCTVHDGFEGEPDTPIEHIQTYRDANIEIIGENDEPTSEEKFNYQMLSRLQADCNYYLGYGNQNKKHLWADNEGEHIAEMKKLYNAFDDDKKPEWLSWDDILHYEKQMTGQST